MNITPADATPPIAPRTSQRDLGRHAYGRDELLACGHGELFGPGNAQLPTANMLMVDRITHISERRRLRQGRDHRRTRYPSRPVVFQCHFPGDPVMPGCLGLDAMWQLVGFFLGWRGNPGRGRALGCGEVKFSGQILPTASKVSLQHRRQARDRAQAGHGHRRWPRLRSTAEKSIPPRPAGRPVHIHGVVSRLMGIRVVITGLGIVSCLGNDAETCRTAFAKAARASASTRSICGMGMRCHVSGRARRRLEALIDRKQLRFMGDAAAYAYIAMQAGHRRRRPERRAGLQRAHRHHRRLRRRLQRQPDGSRRHPAREGPQARRPVPGHADHGQHGLRLPGHAVPDQGRQLLDFIGLRHQRALHRQRHGTDPAGQAGHRVRRRRRRSALDPELPVRRHGRAVHQVQRHAREQASRAYDANRDGFVIAGGGGMLVVEELEHALARGAKIYAELVGYGATSDGYDMVAPSGEGAVRCMQQALATVHGPIDYINAHGTSTPVGRHPGTEGGARVFGARASRSSARPNPCRATRWAPPACRKPSTPC